MLAHELGHFKHRHVIKRIVADVRAQPGRASRCSAGCRRRAGSTPGWACSRRSARRTTRWRCCCSCWRCRCSGSSSRRCSRSCRAATSSRPTPTPAQQADGRDLASALLKLHEDNASTLTPDPLYVRFYYSHPPASERLAALDALGHPALPSAMNNLLHAKCQALEGVAPMSDAEIHSHLAQVSGWQLGDGAIEKTFGFKNYYETIAFVNALAWIATPKTTTPTSRSATTAASCASTRTRSAASRSTTSSAPPRSMRWWPLSLDERAAASIGRLDSGWSSPRMAATTSSRRPTARACLPPARQEERLRRRRPRALAGRRATKA